MSYIIQLPLATNPLSLNGRQHWRVKAQHVKQWRGYTHLHAKHIPPMDACDVTLTWYVTDNRRRDEDNLYLLLKACCDGLVDAGAVPDDTAHYMGKTCRIERAPSDAPSAYMELKVDPRHAQPKEAAR